LGDFCPGDVFIWLERKVSAHMQDRLGPMRVGGWHGWRNPSRMGIKTAAQRRHHSGDGGISRSLNWPRCSSSGSLLCPLSCCLSARLIIVSDLNIGVLYIYGLSTISVIGIIMAGGPQTTNGRCARAMRSAAQLVSYEVPVGLSILAGVVMAGSLSTVEISLAQAGGNLELVSLALFPCGFIAAVLLFVAPWRRPTGHRLIWQSGIRTRLRVSHGI